MTYQHILYDVSDRIATITLNRPDRMNAWTATMERDVRQAMEAAAADDNVRVIVLTGAGRAFCAGADVKDARETTQDGDPDLSTRLREVYNPIITTVRAAPKPVVAAVQGAILLARAHGRIDPFDDIAMEWRAQAARLAA